jgi:hypothetical protein
LRWSAALNLNEKAKISQLLLHSWLASEAKLSSSWFLAFGGFHEKILFVDFARTAVGNDDGNYGRLGRTGSKHHFQNIEFFHGKMHGQMQKEIVRERV